jgi:Domain of unknown function (DUF6265)
MNKGSALWLGLSYALLTSPAAGEKLTAHTSRLDPGATSPPATITDMAWLAGQWAGPALGGLSEEIWSPPKAGSMMGMYRLVRDGKPIFYEMMTLVEEKASLTLRLKHFNPDLTGWEAKDKTIDFPLVAFSNEVIHFDGMSFHRQSDTTLIVYVAISNKGGQVREEAFRYTRVAAESK